MRGCRGMWRGEVWGWGLWIDEVRGMLNCVEGLGVGDVAGCRGARCWGCWGVWRDEVWEMLGDVEGRGVGDVGVCGGARYGRCWGM